MIKKVKVAFDGKVIGEAEVNDAGEVINAEIYPEDVNKLFPNRSPLEGLSIAEPSREMSGSLQDYAREDAALVEWYFNRDEKKGTFEK